jgi:hypothetical protein
MELVQYTFTHTCAQISRLYKAHNFFLKAFILILQSDVLLHDFMYKVWESHTGEY